jgi:hypothetical protein
LSLQCPAQASPEGQGVPPAQPSSAPSAKSADSARMNVDAGSPQPSQDQIPQRTINVSPEGQAAIQRPALPALETHSFDPEKWRQAHPNGNVKAAIARAQQAGFRIKEPNVAPKYRSAPMRQEKLTSQQRVLIRPVRGEIRGRDGSTPKRNRQVAWIIGFASPRVARCYYSLPEVSHESAGPCFCALLPCCA